MYRIWPDYWGGMPHGQLGEVRSISTSDRVLLPGLEHVCARRWLSRSPVRF